VARRPQRIQLFKMLFSRKVRMIALAMAALPICQTTGCFPDLLGAFNFQLQLLINGTLIEAINTIVQNLLHL